MRNFNTNLIYTKFELKLTPTNVKDRRTEENELNKNPMEPKSGAKS